MSEEAPAPLSPEVPDTPSHRVLAWICALIGLIYVVLTIKAITERDLDPLNTTPVALLLIMAAIVFAGGQWLPLLFGRFGRVFACFAAAVGCLVAIQLIPPAWQGPPIKCLSEKCQTVHVIFVPSEND